MLQVNMQLRIDYSKITNQTAELFTKSLNVSVVKISCLQLTLSLHLVFRKSTNCSNTQSESPEK